MKGTPAAEETVQDIATIGVITSRYAVQVE